MSNSPSTNSVPHFPPILPGRGRRRLRRALRSRRALGVVLALSAVLLFALTLDGGAPARTEQAARAAPTAPDPPPDATPDPAPAPAPERARGPSVTTAVRISDPATVQLLSPGDRVDVLATPAFPAHTDAADATPRPARRIAHRVRVAQIPDASGGGQDEATQGALVVLAVSPATAADLAGAAVDSHLAVTRW